jgi:hypothetical protein
MLSSIVSNFGDFPKVHQVAAGIFAVLGSVAIALGPSSLTKKLVMRHAMILYVRSEA